MTDATNLFNNIKTHVESQRAKYDVAVRAAVAQAFDSPEVREALSDLEFHNMEKIRAELEVVLKDRCKNSPCKKGMDDLAEKALNLFDLTFEQDVPAERAAIDAALWFGREEVQNFGY